MSAPSIRFELKPSAILAALLLILHGGAIIILFWISWPFWIKSSLILICIGDFILQWQRHARLSNKSSVTHFWLESNGTWNLQYQDGKVAMGVLQGDSVCTVYFVLLNFKIENKRWRTSIIILPDAMHKDNLRRLRVLLRMGKNSVI